MKEFTPPRLHLLGLASIAWAFVLALIVKNYCYSLLLPLQPTLMAPKHQKLPRMTLPEPKLVKNFLNYGKINFSYNFSIETGSFPDSSNKTGAPPHLAGSPTMPQA